jgi:hypothetical protein
MTPHLNFLLLDNKVYSIWFDLIWFDLIWFDLAVCCRVIVLESRSTTDDTPSNLYVLAGHENTYWTPVTPARLLTNTAQHSQHALKTRRCQCKHVMLKKNNKKKTPLLVSTILALASACCKRKPRLYTCRQFEATPELEHLQTGVQQHLHFVQLPSSCSQLLTLGHLLKVALQHLFCEHGQKLCCLVTASVACSMRV